MLRQNPVPKAAPKTAAPISSEPTESQPPVEAPAAAEPEPEPQPAPAEDETTPVVEQATPAVPDASAEPESALSPAHDELTRTNLEQVVDDSKPPATHTAASTTADSWDPRQSTTATPLSAAQQQHQVPRQASSGFAASAMKATTERATRTPSYQRRVLDQEEAVRMPGNREVDRAAVQFGAFNLGGGEEDVDGDREEPETRAQPPADSPISHPRTSLPPVAQPGASAEAAQRATGQYLRTNVANAADINISVGQVPGPQGAAPSAQPIAPQSQQFSRFGQPGAQDGPQKPLDPFTQQPPTTQAPFDSFAAQTSQPPTQQPGGAFSSAPGDYSSYYTANDRNAYNSYYGHHFAQQQQGAHGQPDGGPGQQRGGFGGYGASQQADNLSQYPQSGAGAGIQQRFGAGGSDNQNSGHSTPNPTTQAQQQQQPGAGAPGAQPQSHAQQYPGYNHPYYNNPYYQHYYSNYGQGGFGPYGGGKGGMYGQPYGMSPNAPFDHQGSPASFAQSSLHRDGGIGSSLDQYGRAGGAGAGAGQTGAGAPGLGGSSNFGSAHDSFARGASSFQSPGFGSQGPSGSAAADDLKPFGDSKPGSGPSPSLGGARPGSAAAGNNAAGAQSGLPPPQSSQLGGNAYGGYPGHMQGLHGSNAYGMGGAGGANSSPYGSYGQGGFGGGSGYYGGGQQQQQQQQQRGGWGGNYH